jgi:hypothetical protein
MRRIAPFDVDEPRGHRCCASDRVNRGEPLFEQIVADDDAMSRTVAPRNLDRGLRKRLG